MGVLAPTFAYFLSPDPRGNSPGPMLNVILNWTIAPGGVGAQGSAACSE